MEPHLRLLGVGRGVAGLLLAVAACARTDYEPVDVQVDVEAPLPEDAAQVRLCVEGGVARTFGAADGIFALTGVRPEPVPVLEVQAMDGEDAILGAAGPVTLDTGYTSVPWAACDSCEPCIGGGDPAPEETAWVVGVRFRS